MDENVAKAVERMCTPLDESVLKGETAKEDARCMALIRARLVELEAVERDAARYRWLRKRDVTFGTRNGSEFVAFIAELGHNGSRLDAAIDAAAQEGEG